MSSLSCKSIFIGTVASVALLAASAQAQVTLNVVSNPTTTVQSTVVETDNSNTNPWPGVNLAALPGGALPAASTYTIPTTVANPTGVTTQPGTDNTTLLCGNDVQFFRTNFTLPTFTNLTFSFQGTVDNDFDIFVNGHELAQEGGLSANSFGTPYGVSVAANGTVTNAGVSGSNAFDRVSSSFPQSFFNAGTNSIVVATRNLSASSGDTGGAYSMLSVVKYNIAGAAAPEPGSIALVGICLLPLAGFVARRRLAQGDGA